MPVRSGFRNSFGSDIAGRPGYILDDHGLCPCFRKPLSEQARNHVGRTASRKRHHQPDCPFWIRCLGDRLVQGQDGEHRKCCNKGRFHNGIRAERLNYPKARPHGLGATVLFSAVTLAANRLFGMAGWYRYGATVTSQCKKKAMTDELTRSLKGLSRSVHEYDLHR